MARTQPQLLGRPRALNIVFQDHEHVGGDRGLVELNYIISILENQMHKKQ